MISAPEKYIFPDSSPIKRLAIKAVRTYARFAPSHSIPLAPTDSNNVRILIQSMGGIGNTLMATPLIAETRRLFPNAQIDLLTSPAASELLANHSGISNVMQDPSPQGTRNLLSSIRATRYDAAIAALNSHLSKFAMRIIFGRIPRRLMHAYPFRPYDDFSTAYTHVIDRPQDRHDVLCNLDLLEALTGVSCNAGPLSLAPSADVVDHARETLTAAGWRESARSVALCQGSSAWMAFKRWPLEQAINFVKLVARERPNSQVVVFCGPEEVAALAEWRARFPAGDVIVVEPLPLIDYAAALQQMDAVVANDSLPMHIAAAVQVPVVALFGPTDPALTGPWACRSRIITADADYAPYYELPYPLDPNQFPDCMTTISSKGVLHAVDEVLAEG